MYRVSLNPTTASPRKEDWIEAVKVEESWSGRYWEFLDAEGYVVGRHSMMTVDRFEQVEDRRKPRQLRLVQPQDEIRDERLTDTRTPA